jgi:hypothetical protein
MTIRAVPARDRGGKIGNNSTARAGESDELALPGQPPEIFKDTRFRDIKKFVYLHH